MRTRVRLSASLCASALLCVSTNSFAQTELPKEGPVAATGVFHSNLKVMSVGDLSQLSYEAVGGLVADKPGGFGDRLTVRCIGGYRALKGKIEFENNMCDYTDPAGDKLYSKLGERLSGRGQGRHQDYSDQWHR